MMQAWNYIAFVCVAVTTLGGAGAIIIAVVKWWKKPDSERDAKLKRHDELLDNDNRRLKMLEEHQAEIEESQKLMMRGMLALMRHAIDGNNIKQLTKVSDDLNEYIINR